jgi:hypothetical protein
MTTIVVGNDGSKKYLLGGFAMPKSKDRTAAKALYPFNEMDPNPESGKCCFHVADEAAAKAASQAFRSAQYEPARKMGKLSYRNVEKNPEMIGPNGEKFVVWLVPHDE